MDYPADKCDFIVRAMEEFKLCYRLSQDHCRFVIPDKLPAEQPDLTAHFNIHEADTLAFEFDFRGFLPRHVMPSLIVTRHEEIVENLVWQNGVLFHNHRHQTLARVQVDYHQRVLQLWLQGEGRREFLEILIDEISKILQRMENLEYEEKVILPSQARIDTEAVLTKPKAGIEKAPYERLIQEARLGQEVTISDSGTQYNLRQVMGLIMSSKKRGEVGMKVEQNFYGTNTHVGAQSFGDKSKASGKIMFKSDDKQAITEFQTQISTLMDHIQVYDADFAIKANAYSELKQIREHLENLENASPEEKGKLRQLLESVKDGSLGAVKLGNEIRDANDTMVWLMEKATIVSALLAGIG